MRRITIYVNCPNELKGLITLAECMSCESYKGKTKYYVKCGREK